MIRFTSLVWHCLSYGPISVFPSRQPQKKIVELELEHCDEQRLIYPTIHRNTNSTSILKSSSISLQTQEVNTDET